MKGRSSYRTKKQALVRYVDASGEWQEVRTHNPQHWQEWCQRYGFVSEIYPGDCAIPRNKK